MARVVRFLMAAVAVLLGWSLFVAPDLAAQAVPLPVHTYDSPKHDEPTDYTASEREPPARLAGASAPADRVAVALWSDGTLASPDWSTKAHTYNYDDRAKPAQPAQSIGGAEGRPTRARGIASPPEPLQVAAKSADEFVDLASAANRNHILYGDSTGGGHLWPGLPTKTPFPQGWSADRVMHEISDVATAPNSVFTPGWGGSIIARGTRDGVDIKVVIRNGDIITGHPTNLPSNP